MLMIEVLSDGSAVTDKKARCAEMCSGPAKSPDPLDGRTYSCRTWIEICDHTRDA